MASHKIDFQPVGRRGESPGESTLLDAARQMGVGLSGVCGGHGKCQACKVKLLEGRVSDPTPSEKETFTAEQLQEGWRLACQTYPAADCKVHVPAESMTAPQRTQVEGLEITVAPQPSVRAYRVRLQESTLSNVQADDESLLRTINREHDLSCTRTDIEVLRGFSPLLRSWNWECQALVREHEIIGVSTGQSPVLGFAADLGTTKIAGYLVDLKDGRTLTSKGVMNPQISYGEDIISRIQATLSSPGVGAGLQKAAVEALNQLASDLCQEVGAAVTDIVDSVIVGNTAMHHLLLGLPVKQLVLAPFVPAASRALDCKARDVGLRAASGAYVHFLPNIAGFVGGDHVAMLLATTQVKASGLVIALDIGTNTEVSLIDGENISSVSCASGPAFEGYHIKHGMRAARGAIEKVRIENNAVQIQTIDDAPPAGICGSGVLDAMAQLHAAGVVDGSGRMLDSHPRVRTDQGYREFVLV
ncbi:MAG TPA: ASKHA domain-containing protein, partial [Desulfatiglandales bacterium]|nr:ASKHA domain-containing protein [Desulfatiglandales bacterium]